jgi:hypothetical protein
MQQSISQKIIFQRYYSLMLNSIGELLKINFISGDYIEGILYSIDPINNEFFIINNPRRLSRTGIPIFLKESKLKIYFREISHIDFEIKNILKYIKSNFETDLQVSKKNAKNDKEEKKLVKYEVNENDKNIFTYKGLEDDLNDKDNDTKWDQFEYNKKKYNVVSTYDENLYTTKLDKSKITKEQNDYAEKIYNEIKNSSYNEKNIHILEDRGIIDEKDGDFDEEDKYSSVIKNKTNNNINKKKNVNVQNFFDNKYNNINGFDQFSQNNNNNCFNNINFANFYNYNNNKFGQDSSNININNKDFQNFPNNNLCNNYIYNNYSKNNNFNNIDLNIKKNNNN